MSRNVAVPHLAARYIHQVPVAQHSSLSKMSKYTASVTAISWKKKGLITPAMANPHMFYFGLSHLCSLTSCRFHHPPNATIMVVKRDVKTSLINDVHYNEVVTVAVYPRYS
jgi:hypothetical protein